MRSRQATAKLIVHGLEYQNRLEEKMPLRTEITPSWIAEGISLDQGDPEWAKILDFFVIHTPCVSLSKRSVPLSDYGWGDSPWTKPSYLKNDLNSILFGSPRRTILQYENKDEFALEAPGKGFDDDFYLAREYTRAAIVEVSKKGSTSAYTGLFHHIRNAIAHGRFSVFALHSGEQVFVFEDGKDQGSEENRCFEVSARMVLKKSALTELIDWITAGPSHQNDLCQDVLDFITNQPRTKNDAIKELEINGEQWKYATRKLKSLNLIRYDKHEKCWSAI